MKKVLIGLMLVSGIALAGDARTTVGGDYREGSVLYQKGDFAAAKPIFEKLITDYPDTLYAGHAALNLVVSLEGNAAKFAAIEAAKQDYSAFSQVVARADLMTANLLVWEDSAAGIVALNKVLTDYPSDRPACIGALKYLEVQYRRNKDLAGLETVLKLWLDRYSKSEQAHDLAPRLADAQLAQKKLAGANTTALDYLTAHGGRTATPEQLVSMFQKISPSAMAFDAYKTALQSILLAVPASATNAIFLGLVKSELEKVK